MFHRSKRMILCAVCAFAIPVSGFAQVTAPGTPDDTLQTPKFLINEFLQGSTLTDALQTQQTLVAQRPEDTNERFRLGMMQFLRALEGLGQDQHRYGLMSGQPMTLPLMRLPIPTNDKPEKLTYKEARAIVGRLLERLTVARKTLAEITDPDVRLPVNLAELALDLDNDGQYTKTESLLYISAVVQRGRRTRAALPEQFPVVFDAGDVPWLEGYCHVLSAMCETTLAYDWKALFDTSAILYYPNVETPFEFLQQETRQNVMTFSTASILDIIAFLHNVNFECIEPERMKRALGHMESMVSCSRRSWKLIEAETDDEREWLPNANQTSIMGTLVINQQIVGGWKDVLNELEAIIQGKKLLPFWRGTESARIMDRQRWNSKIGINFRKIFTEPTRFDLALWAHGSGLKPYLEEGEISTPEDWQRLNRAFGNRFWNFAFWIN